MHNNDDDDLKGQQQTSNGPRKWTPNEEGYYEHGKIKQSGIDEISITDTKHRRR